MHSSHFRRRRLLVGFVNFALVFKNLFVILNFLLAEAAFAEVGISIRVLSCDLSSAFSALMRFRFHEISSRSCAMAGSAF